MPFVKVNDIKLHYEEYGAGYPVVFLHGFAGTARAWQPQVAALSREYRFIVYDARGHGQTESPRSLEKYSADIAVDDLYKLLGRLKVDRAVLGGLSMGGYQCLRFYLKHPDMVKALILMSTGPGYRNPAHMAEWNEKQEARARQLEKDGIGAFAAAVKAQHSLGYTPYELMLKQDPVGLAHMARRVVGQHDSTVIERLAEVKVPTLIVVGADDAPFLAASAHMAKVIEGARRVVIPHAGHAVNIDSVVAFNQVALDFLNGLRLGISRKRSD